MAIYRKPIQNRDVWVDVHSVIEIDANGRQIGASFMGWYRIDPDGVEAGFIPIMGTYIKNANGRAQAFDDEIVAREACFTEAERVILNRLANAV